MPHSKNPKSDRILSIYTRLLDGELVTKAEAAADYGVDERTIQRDIDNIRNFLALDTENSGLVRSIRYSRTEKGYRMEQTNSDRLTNSELLALCKILLDSRAFTKEEMSSLLNKLVACCAPKDKQKLVTSLIRNEEFHYVEPRHKTKFMNTLWEIAQAIHNCNFIEICYLRSSDHTLVKRKVQPAAIMFSEYYFYLTAFIDDEKIRESFDVINDSFPTIYRIDRIQKLTVLKEKFHVLYRDRFEEGEFRKRIQFMYGGKLQKVRFRYSGHDIDAVLDRLPTARVLSEAAGTYVVEAEVFGKGIDMWLRSQGELISDIDYLR